MAERALNVVIEKLSEICNRQESDAATRPPSAPAGSHVGMTQTGQPAPDWPQQDNQQDNQQVLISMDANQQAIFYCSDCGYSSHNKYYLKQHMDLVHNSKRPYKCPFCDYAGKRSYALKEHLIVHSSDRPHQCEHCLATFRKKGHLTNHIKMHQSQLVCSICKVTCKGKQALLNHLQQQHASNGQQVFACDQCLFASNDNEEMVRHIQEHSDPKQVVLLKCSECGFTCNTTTMMQSHMVAVHLRPAAENESNMESQAVEETEAESVEESFYACGVCGYNTNNEPEMTEHMASHVVRKSAVKLPGNEAVLDGSGRFTYNPASRTFACSICSYTCDQQRTIKSHIWKHSGHKDILYPMFQKRSEEKDFVPSQNSVKNDFREQNIVECDSTVSKETAGNVSRSEMRELSHVPENPVFDGERKAGSDPVTEVVISSAGNDKLDVVEGNLDVEDHFARVESPAMDIANRAAVIAQIVSVGGDALSSVAPPIDVVVGAPAVRKRRASDSVLEAKRARLASPSLESADCGAPHGRSPRMARVIEIPDAGEKVVVVQNEHSEHETTSFSAIQKENQNPIYVKDNETVVEPGKADEVDQAETVSVNSEINTIVPVSSTDSIDYTTAMTSTTTAVVDSGKRGGICSSLLAVIEQLRERSGNDDKKESEVEMKSESKLVVRAIPSAKSNDDNWDSNNLETLADGHYRCKLCHYQSFSISSIRQHMRMHKIKRPFECSLCDFIAENSSKLQDHMLLHCKIRTYQCKICPATFPYKSQLRAHQRAHSTEEPFVCEKCSYETANPLAFRNHLRLHNQHGNKEDGPSSEENQNPGGVNEPTRSGAGRQGHAAGILRRRSSQPAAGTEPVAAREPVAATESVVGANDPPESTVFRMTRKTKRSSPIFICDDCEFQSNDLEVLKEHFISRHVKVKKAPDSMNAMPSKELPVKRKPETENAPVTNQTVRKVNENVKQVLQNPVAAPATKVLKMTYDLQCNLCDFTAISVRSLKSHMKRHINDQRFVEQPLEQYKCALCGYVCHHLPSLKSHMWRHASESKYSYTRANDVINAAIDRVATVTTSAASEETSGSHGNQVESFITFRCCQCGFESTDQGTLSAHMKNHQDVIAKTLEV